MLGVGAYPRPDWVLPVAGAANLQTVANSASSLDAPIAAVALPWALLLGRLNPRFETLAVLAEGVRVLRAQAFAFHDVEGPAAQMVLPTDPERGTDAPPAVTCEPLGWLRGTVGTYQAGCPLRCPGRRCVPPGGHVGHTSLTRPLAGGFRTATRTFASARVLGPLLVAAKGRGSPARMRPRSSAPR